jgi:hypothetical protein
MISNITELINRYHKEIRNTKDYFIKIEIGKFHSSELFELILFEEPFLGYLNTKEKEKENSNSSYKLVKELEYYRYQYQNQFYERERNFKSVSYTDEFIESNIFHKETVIETNTAEKPSALSLSLNNDLRISLHKKVINDIFNQQMNYHNIVFVKETVWKITDYCHLHILNLSKKKQNQAECYNEIYFNVNVPLSEQSLNEIEKNLIDLNVFFKHKCDKKYKFHLLD